MVELGALLCALKGVGLESRNFICNNGDRERVNIRGDSDKGNLALFSIVTGRFRDIPHFFYNTCRAQHLDNTSARWMMRAGKFEKLRMAHYLDGADNGSVPNGLMGTLLTRTTQIAQISASIRFPHGGIFLARNWGCALCNDSNYRKNARLSPPPLANYRHAALRAETLIAPFAHMGLGRPSR